MDGILPLWKERGMTSHDCVFKLRKILHMKKIGHGGTLDPDVAGVLPICIGKGTKVIEFLTAMGKSYEGEITLGFSTTTEDASGELVQASPIEYPFSEQEIDQAMAQLAGEITQIPPMYSAVKVNGRRLYDYARNNETVERPKRVVSIQSFKRSSKAVYDSQRKIQSWRFEVDCGKGVYVRTLAVDTAKLLGVSGHMSDLTRTQSAGFTQEQAVSLKQVEKAVQKNCLAEIILPIEYGVQMFKRVDIDEQLWQKVRNGMRLSYESFDLREMPQETIALFYQNQVVSLYQPNLKEVGQLKPLKVLKT